MHRSMMQVFVKNSVEAARFYQKALNAKLVCEHKHDDGSYIHAELDIYGQIFSLSELEEDAVAGNTMMFALHFGEGKEDIVRQAYDVLKEGADIIRPLGECFYSPLEADLVDKFGVRWCIFV